MKSIYIYYIALASSRYSVRWLANSTTLIFLKAHGPITVLKSRSKKPYNSLLASNVRSLQKYLKP